MEEQELLERTFTEGGIKAVIDLVEKGKINPNTRFLNKRTLLQFAIINRNIELVDLLLSAPNIDPNLVGLHGSTAFHAAIYSQNIELVERFLRHPAIDPNQYDVNGLTPLYYAILLSAGADKKIISLILAHPKIQVNKPTCIGITAIFAAAQNNDLQLVKELLEKGAKSITFNGDNPGAYSTLSEIKQLFPESNKPIISSQTWILSKMAAMKHDDSISYGDMKGTCLGVAFTAIVMILANKKNMVGNSLSLSKLNRIMNLIASTSAEHLKEQIDYVQNKKKVAFRIIKQEVEGYDHAAIKKELIRLKTSIKEEKLGQAHTIQDERRLLIDAKVDEFVQDYFSENDRDYLEVVPYLDTVELFQRIYFHKELQRPGEAISLQNPETILPLIESDELIAEGSATNVENFSGLFLANDSSGNDELNIYFAALREKLNTLDFPVSFKISNGAHAISVHYLPNEAQWVFIDANVDSHNKIVTTSDDKEIARLVRGAYSSFNKYAADSLIINTNLYCAGKNRAKLYKCIHDITTTNESFKAIFNPHSEKIYQHQQDGVGYKSWHDAAVQNGETDLVREMGLQATKDKKIIVTDYADDCNIFPDDCNLFIDNYRDYKQRMGDYYSTPNFRKKIMLALNELSKEEGSFFCVNRERKRLKIKFLTEVLVTASPGVNLNKDKENIKVSMRKCYARWQAAGHGLNEVFKGNDSRTMKLINLIVPPSEQKIEREKFKIIREQLETDSPSFVKMRKLINILTAEIVGFSFFNKNLKRIKVEFLTKVIEEASRLSTHEPQASDKGVLSSALEKIIKEYEDAGTYNLVIKGAENRTLSLIKEISTNISSDFKEYKGSLLDIKKSAIKKELANHSVWRRGNE